MGQKPNTIGIRNLRSTRDFPLTMHQINKARGARLLRAQQHALPGLNKTKAHAALETALPKKVKIPFATYASWLNGGRTINFNDTNLLAFIFNVDPYWLHLGNAPFGPYPEDLLKKVKRWKWVSF